MKKCLIIILTLLSFFPITIFAKACSDSEISNKRTLAGNINWAYEYYLKNNKMYFNLIVTNVFDDLYVKNTKDGKRYDKSEFTIQNLADNQKITFEVYSKNCNILVATKDLQLPKYNTFYGTEYCQGISEFSYCGKWNNVGSSVDTKKLKEETEKYRNNLSQSKIKTVEYETDVTGFYIFIILILATLILFLCFLKYKGIKKDFI